MPTEHTAISITTEGPNEFTVRIGDRYSHQMTWEEMLCQVAELTHPEIDHTRFAMLTDEEWAARGVRITYAATTPPQGDH